MLTRYCSCASRREGEERKVNCSFLKLRKSHRLEFSLMMSIEKKTNVYVERAENFYDKSCHQKICFHVFRQNSLVLAISACKKVTR